MTLTIEQKRDAIARVYKGPTWDLRVSRMADHQVHSIYLRLLNAGKIKEKK